MKKPKLDRKSLFLSAVESEIDKAMGKYPWPNPNLAALTEEVGELAKAMLEKKPHEVVLEAIQVAAMAARCALEGDPQFMEYDGKWRTK